MLVDPEVLRERAGNAARAADGIAPLRVVAPGGPEKLVCSLLYDGCSP